MGFAKIIGGGENGRYTIELDWGKATKDALLASLSQLLAQLDLQIGETNGAIAEKEEQEQVLRDQVIALQAQYIEDASTPPAPGSPGPDGSVLTFALKQLKQFQFSYQFLRINLDRLKFEKAKALKSVAYWNNFSPIETRNAWCADYTESAAAGGYVATLEIPGESGLILVAPGARAWGAADGVMTAREIMSPSQAFYNAAILPGWQKEKPTYRWGTITSISADADTASVSLADARSSAQTLNVNQVGLLASVPVVYMECNSEAFEVGDRVVVQFQGQDWTQPRIIGFLDNPRPCPVWPDVLIDITEFGFEEVTPADEGAAIFWHASGFLDTVCGPIPLVGATFKIGRVARRFSRYANKRFNMPPENAEDYEINLSVPEYQDWGLEDVSFGPAGSGAYRPAASPLRLLRRQSGFIQLRQAAFESRTLLTYDALDGCAVQDSTTGNILSLSESGEGFSVAIARSPFTNIASAPSLSLRVTRGSFSRNYYRRLPLGVPAESVEYTATFSPVPD